MPKTVELKKPDTKDHRACPDIGLGDPVRDFSDTFSADTVIMETFFPGK